jgi:hypothetical protein
MLTPDLQYGRSFQEIIFLIPSLPSLFAFCMKCIYTNSLGCPHNCCQLRYNACVPCYSIIHDGCQHSASFSCFQFHIAGSVAGFLHSQQVAVTKTLQFCHPYPHVNSTESPATMYPRTLYILEGAGQRQLPGISGQTQSHSTTASGVPMP